jgi:hypothetical protein
MQTERGPADRDWLVGTGHAMARGGKLRRAERQSSFAVRLIRERQSTPDDAAISLLKRG